jgi:hypothetical protein
MTTKESISVYDVAPDMNLQLSKITQNFRRYFDKKQFIYTNKL